MIGVRVPADLADDTSGLFEITSNKAMFSNGDSADSQNPRICVDSIGENCQSVDLFLVTEYIICAICGNLSLLDHLI